MAGEQILRLSQEVTAGTIVCSAVTPPKNAMFVVEKFVASGALQPDAVVRIVWDWGGVDEVLWTSKSPDSAPEEFKRPCKTGTEEFRLCLENNHSSDLYLSGYVKIRWYQLDG